MKIIPRMSEKSYQQSQSGMYIFDVPTTANKQQIATAVAEQFNVQVDDVNVVVAKGKKKRAYRKGGSPVIGFRKDKKKAYVRLAEGQSIPIFAGVEEAVAEEKK
ncbi:MAG TPA: 50S ribosomal protein L23 [Candidatus Saccharimonadales bacterium]|nr:50S ribosomal protein L23 [Candidatus Saccharimonadales bacterium]